MVNVYETRISVFGWMDKYQVVHSDFNWVFFFSNPLSRINKAGKEEAGGVSLNEIMTPVNSEGAEFEMKDEKAKITPIGVEVKWCVDPENVVAYFLNQIGNDTKMIEALFDIFFRHRIGLCDSFKVAKAIREWDTEFKLWLSNNQNAQRIVRCIGIKIISLQVSDVNKNKALQAADDTFTVMQ